MHYDENAFPRETGEKEQEKPPKFEGRCPTNSMRQKRIAQEGMRAIEEEVAKTVRQDAVNLQASALRAILQIEWHRKESYRKGVEGKEMPAS